MLKGCHYRQPFNINIPDMVISVIQEPIIFSSKTLILQQIFKLVRNKKA